MSSFVRFVLDLLGSRRAEEEEEPVLVANAVVVPDMEDKMPIQDAKQEAKQEDETLFPAMNDLVTTLGFQ